MAKRMFRTRKSSRYYHRGTEHFIVKMTPGGRISRKKTPTRAGESMLMIRGQTGRGVASSWRKGSVMRRPKMSRRRR